MFLFTSPWAWLCIFAKRQLTQCQHVPSFPFSSLWIPAKIKPNCSHATELSLGTQNVCYWIHAKRPVIDSHIIGLRKLLKLLKYYFSWTRSKSCLSHKSKSFSTTLFALFLGIWNSHFQLCAWLCLTFHGPDFLWIMRYPSWTQKIVWLRRFHMKYTHDKHVWFL